MTQQYEHNIHHINDTTVFFLKFICTSHLLVVCIFYLKFDNISVFVALVMYGLNTARLSVIQKLSKFLQKNLIEKRYLNYFLNVQ